MPLPLANCHQQCKVGRLFARPSHGPQNVTIVALGVECSGEDTTCITNTKGKEERSHGPEIQQLPPALSFVNNAGDDENDNLLTDDKNSNHGRKVQTCASYLRTSSLPTEDCRYYFRWRYLQTVKCLVYASAELMLGVIILLDPSVTFTTLWGTSFKITHWEVQTPLWLGQP